MWARHEVTEPAVRRPLIAALLFGAALLACFPASLRAGPGEEGPAIARSRDGRSLDGVACSLSSRGALRAARFPALAAAPAASPAARPRLALALVVRMHAEQLERIRTEYDAGKAGWAEMAVGFARTGRAIGRSLDRCAASLGGHPVGVLITDWTRSLHALSTAPRKKVDISCPCPCP